MLRRGAASVVAAALLTACAGGGADSPDESAAASGSPSSTPSPRPTSVVTPTQDPQTARLRALAELAEKAAGSVPPPRAPEPRGTGPLLGADVSWPQCPRGLGIPQRRTLGLPMPLPDAQYVVLGLTNGPGFTANPCLADQVAWVRDRRLMAAAYAVVSWPDGAAVAEHRQDGPYDGDTRLGGLANTGYQQALANVATMRGAGLQTPIVWLDVEHVPDFEWSADLVANAAVVQGAARGYSDAGYHAGIYSTPSLWSDVVGELALHLPEWRPAGQTSRDQALDRCSEDWSVQGGSAVLVQWVAGRRDEDVTCPGVAAGLGRWFHQY